VLHAQRLYLVGARNLELVVEVHASYIKGMLSKVDIQPNATILPLDLKLVHAPANK
jgi:hypothetical protein